MSPDRGGTMSAHQGESLIVDPKSCRGCVLLGSRRQVRALVAWMTPSAGHPCSAAMGKCVLWSGAAVGEGVLWSSKFSGRTVFFAQSNRSAVGE